jgi:transcription termination/antitermination protein NusA
MRVQSIIRELRGEKIDIIEHSDDPVVFATHALSPAKISRVAIVDGVERHMEVIVDDTQLSLAIGKKGQNVRLAAKLLGWKIDIKSEEEKRQEVESAMAALVVPGAPVSVLLDHGLPDNIVEKLIEAGVPTVERLGSMTPEELEQIQGIGPKLVEKIGASVNSYYGQFEQADQALATAEPDETAPGEEDQEFSGLGEAAEAGQQESDVEDDRLAGDEAVDSARADLTDYVTDESAVTDTNLVDEIVDDPRLTAVVEADENSATPEPEEEGSDTMKDSDR